MIYGMKTESNTLDAEGSADIYIERDIWGGQDGRGGAGGPIYKAIYCIL